MVAHVSAWNYPYFVGCNSIVPALLVGNTVCYKPSEHATLTGLRLVDLMHRAGVPVDVVHAIVGGGATGAALVEADVDLVCFTGSYATGRRVARAAADRLIRVQLELGGKDAGLRVRRRRHRRGRARDRRRRVLQRRAVVQRDRAGVRARVDLGRLRERARRRGERVPRRRSHRRHDRRRPARACRAARRARRAARRRGAARGQGALRRRPHRPARQLVRAHGRGRRARRRRAHARRELRPGDRRRAGARRRRRGGAHGRHRVRARRVGARRATASGRSGCSPASTSATPTGTRPTAPPCGCRGRAAATPASARRCRSQASRAFVREKAWHRFP